MKDYIKYTDEELCSLAQQGDSLAQEALIERFRELVKSRARLYFIVGADSEDVIQEGMIGLYKAVSEFRSDRQASFKTFAALCVNNQIQNAIRNAGRLKHSPLNDSISMDEEKSEGTDAGSVRLENIMASDAVDPEKMMIIRDMIDEIIINTPTFLSRFEQQVWSLYLAGKSYQDIALELDKTPKQIDNALQRIKRKVASYIAG